jgi:deazaflavin-dependent oxidoreductase (nitroreductase family)
MDDLDKEEFCYVTTVGRVTGKPHTIEIWFTAIGSTIYILSDGGESADWVRNLMKDPAVVVKIGEHAYRGTGRVSLTDDEAASARARLPAKYAHREEGLEEWATTATPIAIDLKNVM